MSRPERPLVIAHRGASGYRPENTLPAYELAIEQQADMIEVDLHVTRDGAVVVTHDEDLAGLSGEGEIADATLAQVRALDAGEGERVPILDELLDGFGSRIPLNLELKRSSRGSYPGLEQRAWDAVVQRGVQNETLFSSFFDPALRELRKVAAEARIALLISRRRPERWLERARGVAAEAVNPEAGLVDAELLETAHGEGLAVYVFTVDAPEEMTRLLDLGVDGLFTNVPDQLRRLLQSR